MGLTLAIFIRLFPHSLYSRLGKQSDLINQDLLFIRSDYAGIAIACFICSDYAKACIDCQATCFQLCLEIAFGP